MKNNTYLSESKEKRLKRFKENEPYEIISTLLNSIANYFNNELKITTENNNYQTSLMFLGIHASSLTISEALFDVSGEDGYKLFLEKFVDGDTPDVKFSTIAVSIHNWRNILAHQWIGSLGHQIGYDYEMNYGWESRDNILYINPRIYLSLYLKSFGPKGKIWDWNQLLTKKEQEKTKQRLIKKYLKR